jgi:hypothetical protein
MYMLAGVRLPAEGLQSEGEPRGPIAPGCVRSVHRSRRHRQRIGLQRGRLHPSRWKGGQISCSHFDYSIYALQVGNWRYQFHRWHEMDDMIIEKH